MAEQCAELRLQPAPTEVHTARTFIRRIARPWRLPAELTDDIVLAASELVTNAVVHAASEVRVVVHRLPDGVRLEVEDDGEGTPTPRVADHEQCTGRGISLVAALARAWGVRGERDGKQVWAVFAAAGHRAGG